MAENNVTEITLGIIVLLVCLIYLYERLMNKYMWDVLFAILIMSLALIYIYSNLNLLKQE